MSLFSRNNLGKAYDQEEDPDFEDIESTSDEDEEDKSALLYLPIAPEIEDPEENWVPGVDPSPTKEDSSPHKRSSDASKENTSPKKKRPKTTVDVALENAPIDGKKIRQLFIVSTVHQC